MRCHGHTNKKVMNAVVLNVMCVMDRKLQVNEVQSDAVVLNVTINILFFLFFFFPQPSFHIFF
jgi:hypothetical protein